MLEVCKYMGWDYFTYLEQPQSFIELILARMKAEADNNKKQQRRRK